MIESARDVLKVCWLAHDNDMTVDETRQWMIEFTLTPEHEASGSKGADQIIAALAAAGLAVVPIQPTNDMISASLRNDDPRDEDTWATMLAARPQP